jgi:hypothetical protein
MSFTMLRRSNDIAFRFRPEGCDIYYGTIRGYGSTVVDSHVPYTAAGACVSHVIHHVTPSIIRQSY